MPNSSRFVLEEILALCCFSSFTTVASKGDWWFERILDAAVVGAVVVMLSFIATVLPVRMPGYLHQHLSWIVLSSGLRREPYHLVRAQMPLAYLHRG